jgi:hypothetical protein
MNLRMDSAFGSVHPPAREPAHCTTEDGCITCGDVAVELTVVRVDRARGLALCEDADARRETVEIALVGAVVERDTLLVHAGTAIAHLGGVG